MRICLKAVINDVNWDGWLDLMYALIELEEEEYAESTDGKSCGEESRS